MFLAISKLEQTYSDCEEGEKHFAAPLRVVYRNKPTAARLFYSVDYIMASDKPETAFISDTDALTSESGLRAMSKTRLNCNIKKMSFDERKNFFGKKRIKPGLKFSQVLNSKLAEMDRADYNAYLPKGMSLSVQLLSLAICLAENKYVTVPLFGKRITSDQYEAKNNK